MADRGRLYCGVDIGTTNLKAVLVDGSGRSVAMRSMPTPRVLDGSRIVSDALEVVAAVEGLIAEAYEDSGGRAPLASIAVTGIGEDGVGLDASLRPTGLVLPWFDDRAAEEAKAFGPALAERAGIAVDSSRTAAKWLWLRRHRPENLSLATHWLALADLPAALWTGTVFMSETLAARTACYDVYGREWISRQLDFAGAPRMPPVLVAGTPVGSMRQGALTEAGVADHRTIVAAGGHDHPVAAWAIRSQFAGARVDSMGTANLIYAETQRMEKPRVDPYLAFSVPVDGGARLSCLGVFEFASRLAPHGDLRAVLAAEQLPERPTPVSDLLRDAPDVRASLDACGLYARRMLAATSAAGGEAGPICATGGWSRSVALMQQRASIFGMPIRVVSEPELTAVAAAMLGARACGEALPLEAAAQTVEIEPLAPWIAEYDEIYAEYAPKLDAAVGASAAVGSETADHSIGT